MCCPAVGCAAVSAPLNAWSRVTGHRAVVQCNMSTHSLTHSVRALSCPRHDLSTWVVCCDVMCVGCAAVSAPLNAWSRVTGHRAVVQCNMSTQSLTQSSVMSSWHLVHLGGLLWRRVCSHAVVQCNSSSEAWFLTCRGTTWVGHVGNCTSSSAAYHTGNYTQSSIACLTYMSRDKLTCRPTSLTVIIVL